jgi:DNA gyrase/topoisomerase IV subunit A
MKTNDMTVEEQKIQDELTELEKRITELELKLAQQLT